MPTCVFVTVFSFAVFEWETLHCSIVQWDRDSGWTVLPLGQEGRRKGQEEQDWDEQAGGVPRTAALFLLFIH